jgi:AraC-like DNA-binding protein
MHVFERIVVCERQDPCPSIPYVLRMGHESVRGDYFRQGGPIAKGWWHGVFQFTLSGRGWVRQGGKEWPIGPGQGFLGHLSDPSFSYGMADRSYEDWTFVYLSFDGDGIDRMMETVLREDGPVFTLPKDNDLVRQILRTTGSRPNLSSVLTRSFESAGWVMAMFDLLTLHRACPDQHGNSRLLQAALDVISHRLQTPFNVKTLARQVGYSREHLTKVFKSHLNKTPHQVILEMKIEEAKRQLLTSERSVRDIAELLGMGSGQNFCRAFKRAAGVTPNRYRDINHPLRQAAT